MSPAGCWRRRWDRMPLFWKTYLLSLVLVTLVVVLGEGAEDLAESFTAGLVLSEGGEDQGEFVIWLITILITSLAGGLVLSRVTTGALTRLRAAAEKLSLGLLETRLTGSDLDRGDEVGELARTFNHMADRLTGLLDSQRRLLRDISHELRSPLARLELSLALLEGKGSLTSSSAEADRYLGQMGRDVRLLADLSGELLERARLEAFGEAAETAGTYERTELDLAEIVAEAAEGWRLAAEVEGKVVRLAHWPETVSYRGNGVLLHCLVDNLIRNALRYTAAGTAVEVRLTADPEKVTLEIADRGPGIAPEHLENIFQPFYRVDPSRDRHSGGLGLGLAIVRRAALFHHGEVRAANNPEGGLTVTVTLPVGEDGPG